MNSEADSGPTEPAKGTETGDRNDHEISRDEFVRTVAGGGLAGDAMLQLFVRASSAPDRRQSHNDLLGDFVNEVRDILLSPINPFEGMLEAPTPIVRLYQAHKDSMSELRPHRDGALMALLHDALAALYDGVDPIARSTLRAPAVPEPSRHTTRRTSHDPDDW